MLSKTFKNNQNGKSIECKYLLCITKKGLLSKPSIALLKIY